MRILVLWADKSSANLGVRALADGAEQLCKNAFGASVQFDFQDFHAGDSPISFGGRTVLTDFGRGMGPIKRKISSYDLIVDTGAGDSFTDMYGLKRLLIIAYARRVAARLGVSVAMAPQTIGPFQTAVGRIIARRLLVAARLVVTRDSNSARVSEALGRHVDEVGTDLAFMLPTPSNVSRTRDVIINVSGLLWSPNSHVNSDAYRTSVISLIRLLTSAGRRVSLIAHVLDNDSADNDVLAIKDLRMLFQDLIEILIPTDLKQAREFLASGTVVVGSRLHACLNAVSCKVPVIAWAYSQKFEPLFADLKFEATVDLRTLVNPENVTFEKIQSMDANAKADVVAMLSTARDATSRSIRAFSLIPPTP